jgi:glycosyltransferase involved in cell wall biosynthesis
VANQVNFADLRLLGDDHPGDDPACAGSLSIPVRDHINTATATALTHTDWSFLPKNRFIYRNIIQGSILPLQRNGAVQRMIGDWLIFIDDDMVWQPEDIGRLVAARDEIDADIIGALCFRRSPPYQPTLFVREAPTSGAYNFLEDWDDDIVEVDATGMAFVLIHKRVFEMIAGSPMPPFEARRRMNPPDFFRWTGMFGEDLAFCQDAKKAGARIFVDTRLEVGHIGEVEIRRRQFLQEVRDRPPEVTRERRRINTRMGLPTLTKARVEELLK